MTETVRFGKVDFAVFGIMLLQSTAIGIYHALAGGEQRTTKEFLFANRGMMAIPVALSLIASFMSAITILGVPAEIYIYSTQYWLLFPSVALFFVPVFRAEYISSSYKVSDHKWKQLIQWKNLCRFVYINKNIVRAPFKSLCSNCFFFF